MNQLSAMPDLALILFAPWFLILSVLFWLYPRQPRNAKRRLFDALALLLALVAFVATLRWSHGYADRPALLRGEDAAPRTGPAG